MIQHGLFPLQRTCGCTHPQFSLLVRQKPDVELPEVEHQLHDALLRARQPWQLVWALQSADADVVEHWL
jgi:hypothetical protein